MNEKSEFQIVPIRQIDIYTAVREQLGALISRGGYSPGDKLPSERSLATSLGVSRMAVREAMKVLEYQGRVEIHQGSGTFVARPGPDQVAQRMLGEFELDREFLNHLAEVRGMLECRLVELVIERATDEDIPLLAQVLERNEEEHLSDPEIGSLNLLFEAAVGRIAGNPVLLSLQRSIHEVWVEAWGHLGLAPDSKHHLHREHLDILKAIEDRDSDRAIELMRSHVDRQLPMSIEMPPEADGVER